MFQIQPSFCPRCCFSYNKQQEKYFLRKDFQTKANHSRLEYVNGKAPKATNSASQKKTHKLRSFTEPWANPSLKGI